MLLFANIFLLFSDHERQVEDLLTDELDFLDETAGKHHETAVCHDIAAEITAAESVHNITMGPSADKAAILAAEDSRIVSKAAFDNDKSEVLSENNNISVEPAQTKIALGMNVIASPKGYISIKHYSFKN